LANNAIEAYFNRHPLLVSLSSEEVDMTVSKIQQPARASRWEALRVHVRDGIKWWAEHQAWPATDDVRVDRHHRGC